MKQSTRLSSAVFKLTPTRTRCDLIIIANEKKEKIASGLLNPFLANLKTAQDQIAKGGYSILLEPETDAAWFTKATLERFVRFVSTPEILERVHTIETEILQIEEAISMLSSNDIVHNIVENHQDKPLGGCEANKSGNDTNEEKAIVLYKPDAPLPEVNGSHLQEENSKVQLLKVLETRKSVLQKEQEMAFARAVAASFSIDHMPSLVSFAECFGALRLMEACSRFMDLWKSKQETGEWLDIEASEALTTQSDFSLMVAASGIPSAINSKRDESNFELASKENAQSGSTFSADNLAPNGQQGNFQGQFPHIVFPPWPMHAPGAPPAFQAYPVQGMPYYHSYATGGPFFQPPPHHPMEHSTSDVGHHSGQKLQSPDGQDKKTGSNEKRSGMVVVQNINYVTSQENKSGSELNTDSDSEIDTEDDNCEADDHDVIQRNSKSSLGSKANHLIGSDDGNWQAFQNCLLRGTEDNDHAINQNMFAVEKNAVIKRHKNILSVDQLALMASDRGETEYNRGFYDETDIQHPKILSRSTHEDFVIGSQNQTDFRNSLDPLDVDSLKPATSNMDGKFVHGLDDETLIVPFRSVSLDQADRNIIDVDSEIPLSDKKLDSEGNMNKAYYEPDDLSMMPERGTEKRLVEYDHALDYEMQVCAKGSQGKSVTTVTEVKRGLKKTDKDRRSKVASGSLYAQRSGGSLMKGKQSKMSPPEEARTRAESLRSYKADLQKLKKEKDEAEAKRLEALKLERQKRIAARSGPTSTSGKPTILSPQTKKFPANFSLVNKSKFSDVEPGSSSPLQRPKIRNSLGSRVPPKSSKSSTTLGAGGHMAGNRLTRSSSSLSERKRESHGGTPISKASVSQIRRLSEPRRAVPKRELPEGPERNKISAAIINLDKIKAATLPELKIKTSKSHVSTSDCSTAHQVDADDNMVVEKTVVMHEFEKPSLSNSQASESELGIRYADREKGTKNDGISELSPIHATLVQKQFDSKEVQSRSESMSRVGETVQAHAPYGKSHKLDKNPKTADKVLYKESSSKGLRRLLKFGKKNHTSSLGNQSFDSDCTGVDGSEHSDNARNTTSTTEVFTIKNLISQDETSAGGKASQKISHHFSLFSPFRSKTNDKKRRAS